MREPSRGDRDAGVTVERTLPIRFRELLLSDRMRRPNGEYSGFGTAFAVVISLVLAVFSLAVLGTAVLGASAGAAVALLVLSSVPSGSVPADDVVVVTVTALTFLGVLAHTLWSLRIDRRSLRSTDATRDAGTFLPTVLFLAALGTLQLLLGTAVFVGLPLWFHLAGPGGSGATGFVPFLLGIGVLVAAVAVRAVRRRSPPPAGTL